MAQVRLDKLLCDAAGLTRSQARERIKRGRVSVDGIVAKSPDVRCDESAVLRLDGNRLGGGGFRYIMLNKPAGVLSATRDEEQKTVLDLLPDKYPRGSLFLVGRLDKDTTGLLIITDDGEYCHKVTSPKKQIPKRYEVVADGRIDLQDISAFAGGLVLRDGTQCLPAYLSVEDGQANRATVEIFEGKYHQVKRMFASRGKPVTKLHRTAIGRLELDKSLAQGEFREMSAKEAELVFDK